MRLKTTLFTTTLSLVTFLALAPKARAEIVSVALDCSEVSADSVEETVGLEPEGAAFLLAGASKGQKTKKCKRVVCDPKKVPNGNCADWWLHHVCHIHDGEEAVNCHPVKGGIVCTCVNGIGP